MSVEVTAVAAAEPLVEVDIPKGLRPGDLFVIQMPDGNESQFTVPQGKSGGDKITVAAATSVPVVHGTPLPPPIRPDMDAKKPGCFEQGGCCNPAPPSEQLDAEGNVALIRLTYKIEDACGKSEPFSGKHMPPNIPSQLAQFGVSEHEWASAIKRLEADVQSLRSGACTAGCWAGACLSILSLGILCPVFCAMRKKKVVAWDAAFRAWQADFNDKVLVPKGGFCKSQSLCWVTYGPKGEKQRHHARWVAIALQPHAVTHLRAEPHLFGDIENHSCCNGVNEGELCIHP